MSSEIIEQDELNNFFKSLESELGQLTVGELIFALHHYPAFMDAVDEIRKMRNRKPESRLPSLS